CRRSLSAARPCTTPRGRLDRTCGVLLRQQCGGAAQHRAVAQCPAAMGAEPAPGRYSSPTGGMSAALVDNATDNVPGKPMGYGALGGKNGASLGTRARGE